MKSSLIIAVIFAAITSSSALAAQTHVTGGAVLCGKMQADVQKVSESAEQKAAKSGSVKEAKN